MSGGAGHDRGLGGDCVATRLLAWDSDFYGFPVASLEVSPGGAPALAAELQALRKRGVVLCYCRTAVDDEEASACLRGLQASLVDEKVMFVRAVDAGERRAGALALTSYLGRALTPELLLLALQSGEFSRFRTDPRLPAGSFERMYETWMRRSLSGELAQEVLCSTARGVETGVVTLARQGGTATIGLLAVAPEVRGQGVGSALLAEAAACCARWGVAELLVATQRTNAAACGLYTKSGFCVKTAERIYHAWL